MDSRYVTRRVFLFAPKTITLWDSPWSVSAIRCVCVHSPIPLVRSVHAPHNIACSKCACSEDSVSILSDLILCEVAVSQIR